MISETPKPRMAVLVVEDEPILRLMAVDLVEEAGFEAVEAMNSTDAIQVLEVRTDIRIIFTDIDMPGGLNGVELAAVVRDRWPPVGIIITSGHIAERDVRVPDDGVFLAKPYRLEELRSTLLRMAA